MNPNNNTAQQATHTFAHNRRVRPSIRLIYSNKNKNKNIGNYRVENLITNTYSHLTFDTIRHTYTHSTPLPSAPMHIEGNGRIEGESE